MQEKIMSKGQRGNKEAKKPKKAPTPVQPLAQASPTPADSTSTPTRSKK
jgi:hypothetical protein